MWHTQGRYRVRAEEGMGYTQGRYASLRRGAYHLCAPLDVCLLNHNNSRAHMCARVSASAYVPAHAPYIYARVRTYVTRVRRVMKPAPNLAKERKIKRHSPLHPL